MLLKRIENYYTDYTAYIDISREDLIAVIEEAMSDESAREGIKSELGDMTVEEFVDSNMEEGNGYLAEFAANHLPLDFEDGESITSTDPYEINYGLELD